MKKNIKSIFLFSTVLLILVLATSVSAADQDNTTLADTSIIDNNSAEINSYTDDVITTDNIEDNIDEYEDTTNDVDEKTSISQASTVTIKSQSEIPYSFSANTIYVFDGVTASDQEIYIEADNVTLTGINGATLINSLIYIDSANTTISNLTINYTSSYSGSAGIYVSGKDQSSASNNLYTIIENCNITVENKDLEEGSYWYPIWSESTAIIIRNNYITGGYTAYYIDWEGSLTIARTGVMYLGSEENSILPGMVSNNIILTNVTDSEEDFPSFYVICIYSETNSIGSYNVSNNILSTNGTGWIYSIESYASNSNYTGNNITVIGERYAAGIYLTSTTLENNIIANNTVNLTCGDKPYETGAMNDGYTEDVAYCIVIENRGYAGGTYTTDGQKVNNNTVINNTIIGYAHNIYGIQGFGVNDTKIISNTITLDGGTPTGIGLIGSNSNITGNTITVTGNTSEEEYTTDYINARVSGITLLRGNTNNITNNSITSTYNSGIYTSLESSTYIADNTISTNEYDYAIVLEDSSGTIIENNELYIDDVLNDDAILGAEDDNSTHETSTATSITINDLDSSYDLGEQITITGSLTTESGVAISNAIIKLLVNDEVITTTQTNSNGVYTFTYKPTSISQSTTIQTVFDETSTYTSSSSSIYTISVNKASTTLTLSTVDLTTINSTLTITGKLTDSNGNPISNALITVNVGSTKYETYTNSSGEYSITAPASSTSGGLTINATYNGTDNYDSSSAKTTVEVEILSTRFVFDEITESPVIGDNITISGYLLDENDNPVRGATISYLLNLETRGTLTTDNNGRFSLAYTVDLCPLVSIDMTYSGLSNVYQDTSATLDIDTTKLATSIVLDNSQGIYTVGIGSDVVISGTLVDQRGDAVSTTRIVITVDGTNVYAGNTDTSGKFSYTYTTTEIGQDIPIVITASEGFDYQPTNITATLNVLQTVLDTTLTVNQPATTTVNSNVTVTGKLTDSTGSAISNALITVVIGDNQNTGYTNSNGEYSIVVVAPSTSGSTTVLVSYAGNDDYTYSNTQTTINIEKLSTSLTVNTIGSVNVNSNVTVTGKLTDSTGSAISNALITVVIGDNQNTGYTSSSGEYSIVVLAPSTTGDFTVSVLYAGNGTYTNSSISTTANVVKITTTLTVNSLGSVNPNSTVTVTGKLTDSTGSAISNVLITVVIGDNQNTGYTSSNGEYSITLLAPSTTGSSNVVVTYEGNDLYINSNAQTTLNVEKISTKIELINTQGVYSTNVGGNVVINGTLVDENGTALPSIGIVITINGTTVYSGITDSNGQFSYTYSATEVAQNIPVTITSNNTLIYDATSVNATITVEDTPKLATIINQEQISSVELGKNTTISGVIYDSAGNVLSNARITLVINGKTYTTITNSSGVYTYLYETTSVGVNNVTVSYDGSDEYEPSSTNTTFSVTKITPNVIVLNISAQYLDVVQLTAQITDSDGNAVNTGKVAFKVNGNTLRDAQGNVLYVDVSNGVAQLNYTIVNNPGTYTIKALYYGDSDYASVSSEESSLTVTNRLVNVVITPITGELRSGQNIILTTMVYDAYGQLVENGTVIFKMNGVTLRDANGNAVSATVKNGVASVNYTIPVDMAAKTYTLNAVYSNKNYERVETTTNMILIKSNVTSSVDPVIIASGENATITAVLYDQNGHQLERSTKVAIKVNGKTVLSTTTTNGVLNVTIDTSTYRNSYYNITIIFGENSAYNTLTMYTALILDGTKVKD